MFTPEERRIFGPFVRDGKASFADPAAVYRKLTLYTQGELNVLLGHYQQGEMGVAGVAERLADATIAAFNLPRFDSETGKGTLEDEALDLLRQFLEWRDQKKTTPANSPTSAPSTGQDGWRRPRTREEALDELERLSQANRQQQSRMQTSTPSP